MILAATTAAAVGILLALPAYTAPVVDEAGRVPDHVERTVSAALADYERRSGNEVAVAVVRTTGRQSIEDYANDLAEEWAPGSQGRDNGVVLVIAIDDRRLRIEVGDDVQDELTDLESGRIIQERLVPLLRAGDVGGAVQQGTQAIRVALGDDQAGVLPPPLDAEPQPSGGGGSDGGDFGILPFVVVGLIVLGTMGRRRMGGGSIFWGGGPILWGGGGGGWSGGDSGGGGGGGWSGGGGGGGFSGGGASGSW